MALLTNQDLFLKSTKALDKGQKQDKLQIEKHSEPNINKLHVNGG